MADTKIGNLPTDIVTLADGDKFPVADASALTADTFATALEVKTHGNTAPVFAAGSASADTWPKFTSGTLLTTPEDGAMELDGNCFYLTTDAGNRGIVRIEHFIRADSAVTLLNQTAAQPIWQSPAGGAITLEVGTYLFEMLVLITAMSTTTGNCQFLFGGTGTFAAWLWSHSAIDGSSGQTLLDLDNAFNVTNATASLAAATQTNTTMRVMAEGTFECTGAGTFIPQLALTTAIATATVAIGSYFLLRRVGSTSVASVGQWT